MTYSDVKFFFIAHM